MNQLSRGPVHFGSRLLFLPDGTLPVTIGDHGRMLRSHDPGDHAGSTIRINDDGSVPADNPHVCRSGIAPEIITRGNRHAQGMALEPGTNRSRQSEHGPRGGDELNLIEAGARYGGPLYRTDAIIGDRFPGWQNNLIVASLVQRKLIRLDLDGTPVRHREVLLVNRIGRIRDVAVGPDGNLHLLADESRGGVYRLEPN